MPVGLPADAAADLQKVTDQTMQLMKDATTTGYQVGTGLQGYELKGPAKNLFPVVTPWLNSVPREQAPEGSLATHWKAITAVNAGIASPTQPFGYPGTAIQTTEQDFSASYKTLALGDTVQWDAQALARGFENLKATSAIRLLYALKIEENVILLGGQNFALQAPAAPSLTTSTTGGTIAATTEYDVVVVVTTAEGARYQVRGTSPMGTAASAIASVTTGAGTTNSIAAAVAYVAGGTNYDWYAGTHGGTLYYSGSTGVNAYTLTTIPTSGATAPGTNTSADANAPNGLIASIVGDYTPNGQVTRGTGTSSGAYITSLDNATLTGLDGQIVEIDAALVSLYQTKQIAPTRMIINVQQSKDISGKIVSTGGATMLVNPTDARQRARIVGGNRVTHYLSPATGTEIEMVVDPYMPAGHIVLVSDVLPYPDSNVSRVFEVETQQDYRMIEYAMSRGTGSTGGPRFDFEDRVIEVFKNQFPGGCALLQNIKAG